MLFHKTTLRAPYEAASQRFPDADDVVLVNDRGEVTETTRANLAVRLEGRWVTPPLDAGLLPGCERAALLAEEPETYYLTDHYLNHPVVLVRLSRIRADQLRDLLRSALRFIKAHESQKISRRSAGSRKVARRSPLARE